MRRDRFEHAANTKHSLDLANDGRQIADVLEEMRTVDAVDRGVGNRGEDLKSVADEIPSSIPVK